MPEICRFLGLVIYMFYNEHNPPYFHADYDDFSVMIDIKTGDPIKGDFPRRQLNFLKRWCNMHQEELLENWNKAKSGQPFNPIKPL